MKNYIKNLKIGIKVSAIAFLAGCVMGLGNTVDHVYATKEDGESELLPTKPGTCQVTKDEILEQMKKMNLQVPQAAYESYGTGEERPRSEENPKKTTQPQPPGTVTYDVMLEAILGQMEKMGLKISN